MRDVVLAPTTLAVSTVTPTAALNGLNARIE
jgi:hypothetical protein